MSFIRTSLRILVGAFLLCVGMASALSLCKGGLPPDASPAYVSGWITAGVLMSLIPGVVGFRMMTRKSLPRSSSPSPAA